jgi:hypothetical protein
MAQSTKGDGASDRNGRDEATAPWHDAATHDEPQAIAGVIQVVPGQVSADEKARAKQMLDALRQVSDRAPQIEGAEPRSDVVNQPADERAKRAARRWTPYSDEDSNISVQGPKRTKLKLDDILAEALAPLGYMRVEKLTYRAAWSTPDVEHVLLFETYGNPKAFLFASAGLRNNEAETFAEQCTQRYAHPMFLRETNQTGVWNSPWFCLMHFSVGEILHWGPRESITLAGLTAEAIADAVTSGVRSTLVPFVGKINTIAALLAFLEDDVKPLLWAIRGPYYRAALVAYLAAKLGRPRDSTKDLLRKHARLIASGIDRSRLTPETYIDHILDDAEAAVAQKSV